MLQIHNLHASVENKSILNGVDLNIRPGEVHAIMGPNGSGKSTLAQLLCGKEGYQTTQGTVTYQGKDLLSMDAQTRSLEGIFLGFQYPIEIPGVNNLYFLKAIVNAKRKYLGQTELDAHAFLELVKCKLKELRMDEQFLQRGLNEGFSGGEKKRNEILQMALLEPKLIILDEIDSGLDVDALRVVAQGVNALRKPDRAILVVTHYQRILDEIVPDYVHVLLKGQIVESGDKHLAIRLEQEGYAKHHMAAGASL